jgi:hypothetical protein
MLKKLYVHSTSEFRRGELESLSASSLRELLDSLESGKPEIRGDEPPELTDEEEEILDRIWAEIRRKMEVLLSKLPEGE